MPPADAAGVETDPNTRGSWLFVHVPKCGGTSVLRSIREAYPEPLGLELNGDQFVEKRAILARIADRLPTARVVFGHRVFAGLARSMPRPARMVTVLRDPVDRAISHYNYILTRPADRQLLLGALTRTNVRVPFAAWFDEFPPARNHLVWMLFHVLGDTPRVFDFSLHAGASEHRVVTERLNAFADVHFVEAGGVAAAIRQITGHGPRVESANSSHAIDPADPEARAAAAAACPLDIALYEQARRAFITAPP